ncbi:MAG: hypothetical protein IPM76_07990 [Chloroflexi bacterium]|nr:hypothetical protein [Chloroflexota bacterium]
MFGLLMLFSLVASYYTFRQVVQNRLARARENSGADHLPQRMMTGIVALFGQGNIIKRRRLASIFHWGVAWGFIFYFLVQLLRTFSRALITRLTFANNISHQRLRLLAGCSSVAVLAGIIFFANPPLRGPDKALQNPRERAESTQSA